MDPRKKKRIEQRVDEWARSDPLMQRLQARIAELRLQNAARAAQTERRESS